MGNIQVRHAKHWFAGAAQNWELAQSELGELEEGLEDVKIPTSCEFQNQRCTRKFLLRAFSKIAYSITATQLQKRIWTFSDSSKDNC